MKNEKEFILCGGTEVILSIHENRLLFIHGDFISAQWVIKETGIDLTDNIDNVKLGFWNQGTETYQSLYFELSEIDELYKYFRLLGYPLPTFDQTVALATHERETDRPVKKTT